MSGFQQDANQLSPTFYRVVIDLTGYATNDGNNNGAVYTQDHSQFTTKPTTLVAARRVARGHLRFLSIVEEVKKFADAQIVDIEFTSAGATAADNQPTEVKFTVRYDRDAGVIEALRGTNDTAGTPAVIDTTAKAVKELVVQGLTRGGASAGYVKRVRVFQPTAVEETDESITIIQPLTPANAHTDVTVTLIDGTTLINP
jgi:hypothetical protein